MFFILVESYPCNHPSEYSNTVNRSSRDGKSCAIQSLMSESGFGHHGDGASHDRCCIDSSILVVSLLVASQF